MALAIVIALSVVSGWHFRAFALFASERMILDSLSHRSHFHSIQRKRDELALDAGCGNFDVGYRILDSGTVTPAQVKFRDLTADMRQASATAQRLEFDSELLRESPMRYVLQLLRRRIDEV